MCPVLSLCAIPSLFSALKGASAASIHSINEGPGEEKGELPCHAHLTGVTLNSPGVTTHGPSLTPVPAILEGVRSRMLFRQPGSLTVYPGDIFLQPWSHIDKLAHDGEGRLVFFCLVSDPDIWCLCISGEPGTPSLHQ